MLVCCMVIRCNTLPIVLHWQTINELMGIFLFVFGSIEKLFVLVIISSLKVIAVRDLVAIKKFTHSVRTCQVY